MADWVPFHAELCKGNKRGLSRATRFIFLELSREARKGRGSIRLPVGMTDLDAVHDIIGGNRREIAHALKELTSPLPGDDDSEPMVVLEGAERARTLRIPSWSRWSLLKEPPGASTARVHKHRSKTKQDPEDIHHETTVSGVSETTRNDSATMPKRSKREESIVEEISTDPSVCDPGTYQPPPPSDPHTHGEVGARGSDGEAPQSSRSLPPWVTADWLRERMRHPVYAPLLADQERLEDLATRIACGGITADAVEAALGDFVLKHGNVKLAADDLLGDLGKFFTNAKNRRGRGAARPLNETEQKGMALWCKLWSADHGKAKYPSTARDEEAIRVLVERASRRKSELGGAPNVSDILRHYFAKYLKLDDKRLVEARYPLPMLESRLPAIGEYELPKSRASSEAQRPPVPPAEPAVGFKVPQEMIAGMVSNVLGRPADGLVARARQ